MLPATCMIDMKKDQFEDDGRTICPMDVDGMPDSVFRLTRGQRRADRAALKQKIYEEEPLTRSEYRRYTWYAVLAGLTVLGVIGGGIIAFIGILCILWA